MVCGNNPSAIVLLSQMTQVSRWGQGIHEWQVFMATWQNFTDDARRHVISGSVFLVLYCLQAPCFVGRNTVRILFYTKKKTSGSVGAKRTKGKKNTNNKHRRCFDELLHNNLVAILLYFFTFHLATKTHPPQRVTADITALQGWHTQSLQNTSAFFHNLRDLFKSCLAKTSPESSIVPQNTSNTWKNDEMMLKLAGLTSTRNYMQLIGRYLKSW